MKKWTAAIYLAVVCGVFAASGIACGKTSGCMFVKDKNNAGNIDDDFDDDSGFGMPTPVVTLDANVAVWEEDFEAVGYEYKITKNGRVVRSGMIDSSSITYFELKHGETFSVRSLGFESGIESDWSDEVTYYAPNELGAPVITLDKKGFASWAAVPHASAYEYMVVPADVEADIQTGTTTKTTMEFALKVGDSITVKTVGDDITYASSDYSAPVTCTSVETGSADIEGGERPEDVVKPGEGGEVVFDASKLGRMLNYKETFSAEVGGKANIPVVYVQYDNAWYEAFPWVTCGNEKVDIGGRGTRFYVESLENHIIDYYIEVGGVQKIATTTVTIQDTKGPTFDLPASADGMLVYINEPASLPDWTAYDYSGIQGADGELYSKNGVSISVTYNGTEVPVTNGKFTPTQFGKYQVTYTAKDTEGNTGSTTFNIECARMVEICDFDSLDTGWSWQYYKGEETLGELSTEHRYGDEGYSLKVTTRGTGEGGFIKVVAIPNYFDLSGFDEIAFTIYASESLQGSSAGVYLLNNEYNYNAPTNLEKGENIIRYKISDFSKDYKDGKVMNANDVYKSSDHIWLQFRGPKGVDLYIDNMVGVFYEEMGSDREAPILDLGAGAAIAESKIEGIAEYKGIYGNISVTEGDTIKSAIDKHVHVCDNSMGHIDTTYSVTIGGADVTTAVMNGTRVGTFGETYNLTVTARDASGNSVTKSTQIVVRQKFPTYTKVGMEEITLNYGDDVAKIKMENATSKVAVKDNVSKNGKVEVRTSVESEAMWLKLEIPNSATDATRRPLTVADVQQMQYINIRMLSHDPGAELSLGNGVQLCRLVSGWNNVTIDKATLIAAMNDSNAYNAQTGELKINIYCALKLTYKITIYEVKGVYTEGTMPYEKELPKLDTPQVTIDAATGVASWEAVANATGYTVFVDGTEIVTQATLEYTLQDEQTIEVRANGDAQNYDNSSKSASKAYYNGKVILNNAEDLIYFDTAATKALDTTHVLEGKNSVQLTTTQNWSVLYMYLRIDDKALSKAEWQQYEYVEFNVYSDTVGQRFYLYNTHFATIEKTGWSTIRLTTKDILDHMDEHPDITPSIYGNGFLYMQLADAGHTIYVDKVMAVIGNGSAYVPPQSGGDEGEEEGGVVGVTLNKCDAVAGWIATNTTPTIDTTYKTEGYGSIKVVAAAWNYINIYVRDYGNNDAHVTKAQLMEYDFFYMDVYNGKSTDVNLYMKDQTTVLATLKANAWTQISISKEDVGTWFDDNAGNFEEGTGAYNTFYVLEDVTLYFDNVKGCMLADNPGFVIGGNQSSGGGTSGGGSTETTREGKVVNRCEVAANYWLAGQGMAVTTDSSTKTEGASSLKVVNTADAYRYIVVYLRDYDNGDAVLTWDQVKSYDYLYLDIYCDQAFVNLFLYNCVAAELTQGWNQVRIEMSTIIEQYNQSTVQYNQGEFYFAVGAACTLYFDNIQLCNR